MFKTFCLFVLFGISLAASESLSIQEKIAVRWQSFQNDLEFSLFIPGRSDESLEEEFSRLSLRRQDLWTLEPYETAEHLIQEDLIRAPGCGAFAYNNTVPYYNASTMYLGNASYLACEGPRSKDIPRFFQLLLEERVTHLVRLTDSYEGEVKKCHPYWEGRLSHFPDEKSYLHIQTDEGAYAVRAFDLAHWRDNQGIDPQELLTLVLQVRKEVAEGKLLVHCSAGVGRTGTFFAALAIVDAIDRKESFSIEEIVYRLSLQRVHSVGKSSQYITLHRLAELYSK